MFRAPATEKLACASWAMFCSTGRASCRVYTHACREYLKLPDSLAWGSTRRTVSSAFSTHSGSIPASTGQAASSGHIGRFLVPRQQVCRASIYAASTDGRVKYLYDGSCKVCQTFKSSLQSQEGNKDRINYINIADDSFNPSDHNNVSYDDAMSTIHAITPDGATLKGPDAVRELFGEAGPVSSFLAEASKQPGFDQLFGSAYDYLSHHRFEISDAAQKAQKAVGAE